MSDCKTTYRQIARVSVHKCLIKIAVGLLYMDFAVTLQFSAGYHGKSRFLYRILAMITRGFIGSAWT